MTNFQVKTMLLTMMMNPPALFKNNFLKKTKEFKENMGKPLMINNVQPLMIMFLMTTEIIKIRILFSVFQYLTPRISDSFQIHENGSDSSTDG